MLQPVDPPLRSLSPHVTHPCSCALRQRGWHLMGTVDRNCPTHGPEAAEAERLKATVQKFLASVPKEPRILGDMMLD